ncbi:endoplasmic reticulum membrane sensor NFE2L1-like, partial [Arvicola amphibius]|uniref:endoplasmic reticulum membrane sensor NFE2L1-like n=1 Tax=Arvicola amphibius TaxID=1047088 RepID=UPI0018E3D754
WLVHRDPEGSVSGSQPNSGLALESSSGLQDVTGPDNGVRESETEQGFSDDLEDLGAVAPPVGGDLTKEDIDLIDILWRQDIDLGAGSEVFDYIYLQKEQDVDKELQDGGEQEVTWAGEGAEALARDLLVDEETGESFPAQFPPDVSSITEAVPSESESPALQNSLISPLLTWTESPFDLEQQWQDLMSIMEMQAMEVNTSASEILYNAPLGDPLSTNYSLAPNTSINQNVSLHQASLGGCSQDFSLFIPEVENLPVASSSTLLPLVPSNSTSLNSTFGSTNLAGLFFPSQLNGTANDTSGPELPDPLGGLLDEAMLDEISLMDLAIEEGLNPVQASQLEEEFDSFYIFTDAILHKN